MEAMEAMETPNKSAITFRLHSTSLLAYIDSMNSKRRRTLIAIFSSPTPTSIAWADIETLLITVGCEVVEGNGSRVRFVHRGIVATFHRPHPEKEAKRYQVRDAREYLAKLGIKP